MGLRNYRLDAFYMQNLATQENWLPCSKKAATTKIRSSLQVLQEAELLGAASSHTV